MTGCWRTGRKVGRTIYEQVRSEPSDDDLLIGVMDTPELAREVVEAVNTQRFVDELFTLSERQKEGPDDD